MNGINFHIDGILGRSFMKAQAPHQTSKYALFKKAQPHVQADSTFSLGPLVSIVSQGSLVSIVSQGSLVSQIFPRVTSFTNFTRFISFRRFDEGV